jgi:hypothetical protein
MTISNSNISFVSRDLIWTEPMQVWANHKIAGPLASCLNGEKFELSVHWELTRGNTEPKYEMWTVLQTHDGRANQIVRCRGNDFCNLAEEVSKNLRTQVRSARRKA